jgi:hypothetical protein
MNKNMSSAENGIGLFGHSYCFVVARKVSLVAAGKCLKVAQKGYDHFISHPP